MTGKIQVGILATLFGPYKLGGEDGMRGVRLAFSEFGNKIGDIPIEYIAEGTNAMPDSAMSAMYGLYDKQGVDFTIGPLSGDEGLAVRDYAKDYPDRTFINGIAGGRDMTLRDPAPNFFSFTSNGVQWTAGMGRYAYEELGYRRVVTLGEDYSFPHGQVAGFTLEFCKAGGQIVEKYWIALGTRDYSSIIRSLPDDLDAIYLAIGGTDIVNFLQQYRETGRVIPLMGGSIAVDHTAMNSDPDLATFYEGMISSGPIADNNPSPSWTAFQEAYQKEFSGVSATPSLFSWGYYVNTKGALLALQAVNGDLSNGQAAFQKALSEISFESPTGMIRLDHNRNAISDIFITMVERNEDGTLYNKLVSTTSQVDQTLGIPEEEYLRLGVFGPDNPPCIRA